MKGTTVLQLSLIIAGAGLFAGIMAQRTTIEAAATQVEPQLIPGHFYCGADATFDQMDIAVVTGDVHTITNLHRNKACAILNEPYQYEVISVVGHKAHVNIVIDDTHYEMWIEADAIPAPVAGGSK